MTGTRLHGLNEPLNAEATPHLSYSRLQKYLTCPEQYRLYYIGKLRAMVENVSLVFGSVMHLALAAYFRHGDDPAPLSWRMGFAEKHRAAVFPQGVMAEAKRHRPGTSGQVHPRG